MCLKFSLLLVKINALQIYNDRICNDFAIPFNKNGVEIIHSNDMCLVKVLDNNSNSKK